MVISRQTLLDIEKHLAPSYDPPPDKPPERREEPRYPTAATAKLTVRGAELSRTVEVQIVDVSRSGLGLKTPQFLTSGSTVSVELETMMVTGRIRWCRQSPDGGFRAGLRIERAESLH